MKKKKKSDIDSLHQLMEGVKKDMQEVAVNFAAVGAAGIKGGAKIGKVAAEEAVNDLKQDLFFYQLERIAERRDKLKEMCARVSHTARQAIEVMLADLDNEEVLLLEQQGKVTSTKAKKAVERVAYRPEDVVIDSEPKVKTVTVSEHERVLPKNRNGVVLHAHKDNED